MSPPRSNGFAMFRLLFSFFAGLSQGLGKGLSTTPSPLPFPFLSRAFFSLCFRKTSREGFLCLSSFLQPFWSTNPPPPFLTIFSCGDSLLFPFPSTAILFFPFSMVFCFIATKFLRGRVLLLEERGVVLRGSRPPFFAFFRSYIFIERDFYLGKGIYPFFPSLIFSISPSLFAPHFCSQGCPIRCDIIAIIFYELSPPAPFQSRKIPFQPRGRNSSSLFSVSRFQLKP